jgi:hypothetical protein
MHVIVSWVSDLFDVYVILLYLYSWICSFLYDTDLSPTGTTTLLAQDNQVQTDSGKTVGWSTLLPVFVYMESLIGVMTHPDMTLKGFILYRDESFRMVCEIVTTCALWTPIFWRYPNRLVRFFASIRLHCPSSQVRSVSCRRNWPKRPDASLSMREVETPGSARSKRLMALMMLITLGVIVRRLVNAYVGSLTTTPVRG